MTEMWKLDDQKIAYQMRVAERNEICISNGIAVLHKALPAESEQSPMQVNALLAKLIETHQKLPAAAKAQLVKKVSKSILIFKVNGVIQLSIKDSTDQKTFFYLDLKNGHGTMAIGRASVPDVTIEINDRNLLDLVQGKLTSQIAFMKGLIKLSGNITLAAQLEVVLKALMMHSNSKL